MNNIKELTEKVINSLGLFKIEGDELTEISSDKKIGEFSRDGILDLTKSEVNWEENKDAKKLYEELMERNIPVTISHCLHR